MIREQRFINDDWTFAYGEHPGAESAPADDTWFDVGLPHTFDLPDFREQHFYVGHGCYRRTVHIDPEWIGRWVALEFMGVFQTCEVYLNGRLAGRHEGGFTPFTVDLSNLVKAGANDVFIRVDNIWNPRLAPRAGDYSFNGGIHRDVSLVVADQVRIDWYGIGVTTPEASAEHTAVNASVTIVNDERHPVTVAVAAVITDPARHPVAAIDTVYRTVPARSTTTVDIEGAIDKPLLWHPDHPHRYTLTASVAVDGIARDTQTTHFGVRWYEFTADQGFFLNGEHLDLHGANVHQNHGGWGDAVTRAGIRRDITLIKETGMNIIRGSHYPHHPYFAEECDRQGLLFWSELHFWGMGGESVEGYWFASAYPVVEADEADFEESLRRALREMIRTQRNHPSIITWSIGNEAFFSDEPVMDKARALTVELVALAKELDPTRQIAVGGVQRGGFDVLGEIAGYNGDGAELFHDPGIPNLVSEYHGVQGRGPGTYEVRWEHGVEVDYPWRSGKILWCGFHYKSIAEGAGLQGIVNYWRVPRRSYWWYRKQLRGIEPPVFPEPGTAVALRLRSDFDRMPTDGTGDVQLTVEMLDADGNHVLDDRPVQLTVVEGEGLFPSGRSITLSPETDSIADGQGAVEFRSYVPGVQRIRARSEGLRDAEITVIAEGEPKPARTRPFRHAEPAPSVMVAPEGSGMSSLVAYRPVAVSSAEPGHEGGHVTLKGDGFWRAARRGPEEWIAANLEFEYDIKQVEIAFAEPVTQPWVLESSLDGREFSLLYKGVPEPDAVSVDVEFDRHPARYVRVSFPEQPLDVREIRVH
ncbi:glycoside hydrolase family 2 TIM barrel-domain containing protein [Glycomyces sp. NPDC048151]|uniref:glycoside hydrolase family 2 TIM barrel-domain containing protein n=1 Tax=Glycomyces sp. NPDC048151 TaxID=3364002 RepID=UPI0037235BFC